MPERRFILTTPQINTLFHAKINGIAKHSNVESATNYRVSHHQLKTGTHCCCKHRQLRQTYHYACEHSSVGIANSAKAYIVRLLNDDNPTTNFDENDDALFTYSTKPDNSRDRVYSKNGEVDNCAGNASSATILGTLKGVPVHLTGGALLTIAEGTFENLKYLVVD